MQFRVFLKCCFKYRNENERNTEILTKKAVNTSKDNSLDRSDNDISKNKEDINELQQSQPIPEDYVKTTISQNDPNKQKISSSAAQNTNTSEEKKTDIIKGSTITPVNYEDFSIITDEMNLKGKKLALKIHLC